MKIALQGFTLRDYTFGKPQDSGFKDKIKTALWRVKDIGYDGIEMGIPAGFELDEYKECVDGLGLQVVTLGGMQYLDKEDYSEIIKECKALGTKNVMIPCMPNITLGNPYELRKFIEQMNRMGAALMAEGIYLSYHNHAIDFAKMDGKTILDWIVDESDPASVFIELDTHWTQAGGAHVITWLKKLKGRMYMVHFKDYGIDAYSDHVFLEGTHKLFMEVGEGNMNWAGIIGECKAQEIEWCAIEQDICRRPAFEAIRISLENLKGMGA